MSIIEAVGVGVEFDRHPVLHDVNLTLAAGETVALLGGNGSGKTTLLRTLLGLVSRSAGEVRLLGTPLESFKAWDRVGYVPQRSELHVANATVAEIVTSGRLARRKVFRPTSGQDRAAVATALEQVGLTGRAKAEMAILSGGQRQRAMIARALAGQPDAILLDEPMAGLDTTTQDGLATLLGELKQAGLATLVVLHELGPMEPLIDRAIVLRDGSVIHDGPLRDGPGTHHGHGSPEEEERTILIPLETYLRIGSER